MVEIINNIKKGRDRHWRNFIDKDYLGGHNLEEGENMILTISKVAPEEQVENHSNHTKESKIVLYFEENVPKMILNITNANVISQLYGSHIEDWEGKKIQLMTSKVKAFGKIHDALRVREIIPKGKVTVSDIITELNNCKTLKDLQGVWVRIPVTIKKDKTLIELKDKLKVILK